jgi:hypothetical protein
MLVYKWWADNGTIITIRTPGNQRLFDPSSIQGYLIEQEKKPAVVK